MKKSKYKRRDPREMLYTSARGITSPASGRDQRKAAEQARIKRHKAYLKSIVSAKRLACIMDSVEVGFGPYYLARPETGYYVANKIIDYMGGRGYALRMVLPAIYGTNELGQRGCKLDACTFDYLDYYLYTGR